MPIGKPIAFQGNILKYNPNAFGFFYCKIKSPEYLEHPILQRRIKTSNGIRTIAGLGSWEDWVFSEEMYNAIKYGYIFEVIKGYEFNKGNIFGNYINDNYNLRLEYPKGHPMNDSAKLLNNSLYGKFAMLPETTKIEILDNTTTNINKTLDKLNTNIQDILILDNYIIIIHNKFIPNDNTKHLFNDETVTHQMDVNIAIASAITAYARIHMSQFKNNPLFNLYYSDTDSITIDKELPAEMIGNALGQLKLEHVISKAVFLAPKVYGYITKDGNEIIKAKGLTKDTISNIKVLDLDLLLKKDSIKLFNQDKLYKNLFNSEIKVLDTAYTLKVTSNKRDPILMEYFLYRKGGIIKIKYQKGM